MAVDIKSGDLLVVNDGLYVGSYPVNEVSQWAMSAQSTKSFARLATVSVSRKRKATDPVTDKITPAENDTNPLTGLKAVLDPMDSQAMTGTDSVAGLNKPTQYLQAYITDGTSFVRVVLERKR